MVPILGPVRRLACLVLAVALAAAGGCRRGSESAAPPAPSTAAPAASAPATTTPTVPPAIRITATPAGVESMRREPVAIPGEVHDAVVATLNTWLDLGVVKPLLSGQPAAGLDAAFTPEAGARLTPGSPDRAAMLEEGAPAGVHPEAASAALVGLAAPDGSLSLVTALVEVAFVRSLGPDRVRVVRTGEVLLVPAAGGWRIDGYDVVARRDTLPPPAAAATTTTTARALR